ncbi:MAG: DEAD/DEAH box helicase [Synergistaceae bacterium]|nr:DEAD/DEAH box helicase [Synergistaceae bacterium]
MSRSKLELRPYQKDALASIPEAGAFLIQMAVGLGKTVTFSQIPRRGRMLILSHRDELVHQPQKYFDCSFGVEQAKETSHDEEVVSASVQSLVRRLDKFKPDDFDVIITDEAHHAAAPSYRKIYDYFKPRLHLGFTATPNRNDGVGLQDIYQDIIFQRDLKWGIKNGYLSNIHCLRVDIGYDLSRVALRLGDFAANELDEAVNIEKANKAVAEAYKRYAKPPCLIFCASVSHAENLASLIPGAVAVRGGEDREQTVQDFKNGKIPCLTNCMVFTEGTDIPNINTIIMARPTKNISLYTQCVGRATRLYPDKEYATIIDCVGISKKTDLCTAPSLIGLDISEVPPRALNELQGDLFDLPDIVAKVSDCPEAWIKNVEYIDLWARNNNYNMHGVNWFKHPDGTMTVLDIQLPPEDSLGRIEYNGTLLSSQTVFDLVYQKLRDEYDDKKALWDLDLVKRWGDAPASDKQKDYVKSLIPALNVETLTKFEASQILARKCSIQEPATQKQKYFLRMHGFDTANLTKREASKMIAEIKS